MAKRAKLEIIKDILKLIQENHNSIKPTPLLRKSNLSSQRFSEYLNELLEKQLVRQISEKSKKSIKLTEKGFKFLERYSAISNFIEEFDL